ncbi:hypothetical protein [Nonlabens sp. SY33080]|uniref:hypothetical protein n=1 Tax=Nonlabens sp. SY33080 TaxID=2719911 RepID=UPI001428B77F|nr:hypothetical protein [Nonlabens sp. SY33080]
MKTKLSLLLFLSIACFTYAQLSSVGNVSLQFGSHVTAPKGDVIKVAGEVDGVRYALAKHKKKFFIQTFDASSNDYLKCSKELKIEKIGKARVNIEDMEIIDGKPYIFGNYYDKKAKQDILAAFPIKSNLTLGKPIKAVAIDVEKKSKRGYFFYKPSYDERNYIVTYVTVRSWEESLTYDVTLLNGDMETMFTKHNEQVFKDRKDLDFSFDDFIANEYGDVFVVISDSYRDKKKRTTVTRLMIHAYYANNNYEMTEIPVDLKGKKVVNCNMLNTLQGRLQLVGFYSNLTKRGRSEYRIEGIFNVSVDTETNSVVKNNFNTFTYDVKKKLIGERRAKKGKNLLPFYRNTHIIERDNGGIIVMSEFYQTFVGQSSGIGPLAFTPITYITNEVIVSAMDAEGNLEWSNVLPKEQKVTVTQLSIGFFAVGGGNGVNIAAGFMFPLGVLNEGPEYLSSIAMYEKGKLSVLVNDDPKNIGITEMDDMRKVRNVKKMIPVLFEFDDATGKMTRTDPDEYKKKQLVLRPAITYRKAPGEYVIFASNKDKKNLGTLYLN